MAVLVAVKSAEAVEWEVLRQASAGNTVLNERVDRFRINGSWLEIPLVRLHLPLPLPVRHVTSRALFSGSPSSHAPPLSFFRACSACCCCGQAGVFDVVDGLITRWTDYWDMNKMREAQAKL
eukprot:COSAG04_NODE_530_length_12999_cov_7.702946_15_plen_122_part_00